MDKNITKKVKYKHKKTLDYYLSKYLSTPYSKRSLCSIRRFEDMYKPKSYLYGGRFMPGYESDLKELKNMVYLTNKKLVKRFDTKHGKQIMLTSSGDRVLFKMYPLSKLREQKWDKKWTLVSYDISKDRNLRNALRRLITDYGFGKFHQSLYLSPLNISTGIAEYFENKELLNAVSIFRADNALGLSNQQIANKIYNIQELNILYKDLYINYSEKLSKKQFTQWKNYFIAVNYFDPYLPYELLPNTWYGDNCESLFKKGRGLKNLLRSFAKNMLHV